MKIRIKGNSIRLRLTHPEIIIFEKTGYLEEQVEFGNGKLIYALKNDMSVDHLTAGFFGNKIVLNVPEQQAIEWTQTERVGFEHEMEIGEGKILFLLVEKDFKCLDRVGEDQSDQYENPYAVK